MQFVSDNKTRQKTWRERAGNLQALAKLTAQTHPDNAFLLFLEGGKYVETIQEAPAKLKGIFEDPAWVQHVLRRIQTANTSATPITALMMRENMVMGTAWLQHCLSNKLVAQSPVQVSTTASGLVCNCETKGNMHDPSNGARDGQPASSNVLQPTLQQACTCPDTTASEAVGSGTHSVQGLDSRFHRRRLAEVPRNLPPASLHLP
ncbi:hypothetical protein WJX77_012662 [Trebouxia sp. C0004]